MAGVNHVDRSNFEKYLTHIAPCNPTRFDFTPADNALCSLYLHQTHGFKWDIEVVGKEDLGYGGTEGIQPTGWGREFDDDV